MLEVLEEGQHRKIKVWGDFACFTKPEFSAERVTYDVITPSAAVGLLESILWHPGMDYRIDKIYIMNPIKHFSMMRNEVGKKANSNLIFEAMRNGNKDIALYPSDCIQQRTTLMLKDVCYVIEFHIVTTEDKYEDDTIQKFEAMLDHRIKKGKCYCEPYFGCREYFAFFDEWDINKDVPTQPIDRDFGNMFYGFDYTEQEEENNNGGYKRMFYKAIAKDGIIDVEHSEVF